MHNLFLNGTLEATHITPPVPLSQPVVRPLSYQFQVIEWTDENDKVIKVELQVQETKHDPQTGMIVVSSGYVGIPRVRMRL
jgi:hypothetical protein